MGSEKQAPAPEHKDQGCRQTGPLLRRGGKAAGLAVHVQRMCGLGLLPLDSHPTQDAARVLPVSGNPIVAE